MRVGIYFLFLGINTASRPVTILHAYRQEFKMVPFLGNLLVKKLKAGLADTNFLLYTKLRNGGVLGGTLATENLATGSTMVLEQQRAENKVKSCTCAENTP